MIGDDRRLAPLLDRVLLPMTMADSLRPALAFAMRCAQALAVPLEALFIEDEDLLAFAGLPFARTTALRAMEGPGLDVASVIHRLGLEARRARRMLEAEAATHSVTARFATVRAQPRQALASASRASDLLVVGGGLAPWERRAARDLILGECAGGLLLLEPSARPCRAITVIYGNAADDGVLDLASRLAEGLAARLDVVVLAQAGAAADALRARAVERLAPRAVRRFSVLAPERVGWLIEAAPSQVGELVIVTESPGRETLEVLAEANRSPRRSMLLLRCAR